MQTIGRLTALSVAAKRPGYHADGANLYLRVLGKSRGWIFRYSIHGTTRDMGLGSVSTISLAAARKLATKYRALLEEGIDPIEQRRTQRAAQRIVAAKNFTFDECAREYIMEHEDGWRNAKHRAQWASTLKRYVSPVFGRLPAMAIDTALVLKALKPIWKTKPETASRVRGRIEAVLDWARVHGYRTGENPARWKGNLKGALPDLIGTRIVQHHAALTYSEIGTFMASLRERDDCASRALEFTILTAARTTETIGATWSEIDFRNKVWTIPPERMKARRAHRVPLAAPVLVVLQQMQSIRDREFVFPGAKSGRSLSNMAMLKLLDRMGRGDLTVHGFRSTFRDWAAERTNFPREVAELALAHRVGSDVELAYRRSDLFEKRRRLMAAWADYCATDSAATEIIPLRRNRGA
jgi:integrase